MQLGISRLLVLLSTFALAACGAADSDGPATENAAPERPQNSGDPQTPESNDTIQGQPADQYFEQFVWGDDRTPIAGAAAFPKNAAGFDLFIATVFLRPDSGFDFFYVEGTGDVTLFGWSAGTSPATMTRLGGTWKRSGQQIVLSDLMTCVPGIKLNGKDNLSCKLNRAVISAEAVGKHGNFSPTIASSPNDSRWAEYQSR